MRANRWVEGFSCFGPTERLMNQSANNALRKNTR